MPRIAFFVVAPAAPGVPPNDNHQRLPSAFADAGWHVACFDRDSLAVRSNQLTARTLAGECLSLAGFDLYFVLGFGAEATFLDRMQLLRSLDQRRFVNSVDALVFQHGKMSLILACPDIPQPASYLSNDAAELAAVVAAGGDWIAKPPASSFGRDVFRLHGDDTNMGAILAHLVRDGRYALLQERVETGAQLEKRVLIVAGKPIGVYAKQAADHRGNLDAGASPVPARLTPDEREVVERLGGKLDGMGVRFAAADLINGRVLEINVANPGWLKTYQELCGEDRTARVRAALQEWWQTLPPC